MKLADKGLRIAIINNFKDSKENVSQGVNRWGKFKRQKLWNEPNKNSRLNSIMSVIKNSLNGLNRKIDGQKSHWTEDRSIEITESEEEKDTEKYY